MTTAARLRASLVLVAIACANPALAQESAGESPGLVFVYSVFEDTGSNRMPQAEADIVGLLGPSVPYFDFVPGDLNAANGKCAALLTVRVKQQSDYPYTLELTSRDDRCQPVREGEKYKRSLVDFALRRPRAGSPLSLLLDRVRRELVADFPRWLALDSERQMVVQALVGSVPLGRGAERHSDNLLALPMAPSRHEVLAGRRFEVRFWNDTEKSRPLARATFARAEQNGARIVVRVNCRQVPGQSFTPGPVPGAWYKLPNRFFVRESAAIARPETSLPLPTGPAALQAAGTCQ